MTQNTISDPTGRSAPDNGDRARSVAANNPGHRPDSSVVGLGEVGRLPPRTDTPSELINDLPYLGWLFFRGEVPCVGYLGRGQVVDPSVA
jgi:hypothetical protein